MFFSGLVWLGWVGGLISGCFTIILFYFLLSGAGSAFFLSFFSLYFSLPFTFLFLHFCHRKINNTRGWFIRHSMGINCGELKKIKRFVEKHAYR